MNIAQTDNRILTRFAPWLLIVVTLLVLVPGNNTAPLIDRDEPRFAQATLEMIQRNEWVVPYFNDEYRFDKPVLIYWLMRPFYHLVGVNEFTARLPSVLSALLIALLLYHIGKKWFSKSTGIMAGIGFLTCIQVLIHGRSAVADMPMVLCILASQYALFELLYSRKDGYPWKWFYLFYIAQGIGFLAKGPIVTATPIITLVLHRILIWRKPAQWKYLWLGLPAGLAITLLIVALWGLPALYKTNGEFLSVGIYTHVWERGFDTFQGHGSFFLYYLVVALITIFPWIAFAGFGIRAVYKNWNEKNMFLLSWLVGTYVAFSFYMTKLPHYVLPAYPAFFLLLGQCSNFDFKNKWATTWFWFLISLISLIAVIPLILAFTITLPVALMGIKYLLIAAGLILLGLAITGILWKKGFILRSILALCIVSCGLFSLGKGLRMINPAVQSAEYLNSLPAQTVFAFDSRVAEPSFPFYTNQKNLEQNTPIRKWHRLSQPEQMQEFMSHPGPRALVVAEKEIRLEDYFDWIAAQHKGKDSELEVRDYTEHVQGHDLSAFHIERLSGINIARSSYVEFLILYKE